MELWTSWIQGRLEELQGRGNIATNNFKLITVLKIAIHTNGDLLLPRFDNQKTIYLTIRKRASQTLLLLLWIDDMK